MRVGVVGAGAAGMTAAIFCAESGADVTLFETRSKPGAKIRVSGGGRCNVLPSQVELEDFRTSGSTRSLRNVLFSWPLEDVTEFFTNRLGIPLRIEETGKVFPQSDRPQDIVEALVGECDRLGVQWQTSSRVRSIQKADSGFKVELDDDRRHDFDRIILCAGGLSLPRTGSDGHGFEMARQLGHEIADLFPVLVPLLADDSPWLSIPGLAFPATLKVVQDGKVIGEEHGDFLFTHRGFSGPVVLDISRTLCEPNEKSRRLLATWGGQAAPDWSELLGQGGKRSVFALLREHLPKRLAELLMSLSGLKPDLRVCDLCREARDALIESLVACELEVTGDEGYRTAEATGGGIRLKDLQLKTLESRQVPGLYFAGEIIDVDGRIGGYNFLWSWVTGRKAGAAAGRGISDD